MSDGASMRRGTYTRPTSTRKNETMVSSTKKATTNSTEKKSKHQNISLAQTQKVNYRKSLNETLNLTTNTINSNFTYAATKYQVPSYLKPNNHTLTKYKSPTRTGQVSNRSKRSSAAKTAEIYSNQVVSHKLSRTIQGTPVELSQTTPYPMTQGYMNQTLGEDTISPRTPYSVAKSTEMWPVAENNSQASHVVSPRDYGKPLPHKQQIKTVTGQKV